MALIESSPTLYPSVVPFAGRGLTDVVADSRAELRRELRSSGALLFRGFDVGGSEGQQRAVEALSGVALGYTERSSPRRVVSGRVYTSTDYPASEEIFLHNENSYQATWPMTLFFHCVRPADTSGATPLADTRQILARIDPEVVSAFRRRGWMVARTYREDLGLSWRYAFDTDSRAQVESYCASRGLRTEWLGADVLRTVAFRDAVHRHPVTGADVWFNHLTVFHVSTLPDTARRGLLEMVGEYELPSNTYYGDGAPIEGDVLDHLRDCYRQARTRFDYRTDDLLVIDNMLTAHGREPFTGPRQVTVAMAEPSDGAVE
ncbi:TauD/TfdA family dioxygenase [Jatrophihabitans lederbergiae]|uniref:TauD/TfdA family dioxygenase n=1 Tax=Jatrophihabitans lederbergiae TaxID=3075547 RepID=A0ABU2JDG5_9ACTN|nr:TauD/TfdA family dioxygenase [Jatrophihabitans sp. DSM 44399]MDT0262313.1 TauD/TfdA family dioxygenase [Jatrophihabitans sp. DSM 44399]